MVNSAREIQLQADLMFRKFNLNLQEVLLKEGSMMAGLKTSGISFWQSFHV